MVISRANIGWINQVLDRSYFGNFEDLVARVSLDELRQPLVSSLGREAVSLPIKDVITSFGDDLFSILKLYALLTNRYFPYGAHCFEVTTEQRVRFISGHLTAGDLSDLSQSGGSYQWHKLGFKLCLGREKDLARNKALSVAADFLRRSPIRYLGLEQPHLEFIRRLCSTVVFQSEASVIAERDPRTFNVMRSLLSHGDEATRRLLSNFNLQLGSVEDLIPRMTGRFNFVFLDFFGYMTQSYEKCISCLFDSDKLQDRSIVFITLLDIPMSRVRAAKRGYVGDPGNYVPEIFQQYAGNNFAVTQLLDMTYAGGMSRNVSTNMRVFGFGILRKES